MIQLEKKYRIESVCSKDKNRIVLQNPYLDVENKFIVSTNGFALARVPVTIEESDVKDTTGLIDGDLLGKFRKAATKHLPYFNFSANGRQKDVVSGLEGPRPDQKTFPRWTEIIPKDEVLTHSITINADVLIDLCASIGARGKLGNVITLRFNPDDKTPIKVETKMSPDAFGLIMQCKA